MRGTVGKALGRGVFRAAAIVGVCVALGACGMSQITAPFTNSGGLFGSSKPDNASGWTPTVTEANMLSAAQGGGDVSGASGNGCPSFAVATGEGTITMRAPKAAGMPNDPLTVAHRGEITNTARECSATTNGIALKLGFAGRVLLGPEGRTGNIMLPAKLTIVDPANKPLKTETVKVPVTIQAGQTVGFFSMVHEMVVPVPAGAALDSYKVYIGFDRAVPGAS